MLAPESRIKGTSAPVRLEGGGSEGNFSFLEAVVQRGDLVSRTHLCYWG